MSTSSIIAPTFSRNKVVEFMGGIGNVKHCYFELGGWIYLVEMEMGPEPEFGRIGCETAIFLSEVDIISVINYTEN
jgi:hypothetical protein